MPNVNGKLLAIVLILSIAGPAMFLASPALGDTNAEPAASPAASQPTATTYSQVSAGGTHRCALRTDQTIACWGNNSIGQMNVPDGQFSVVSVGWDHACGLRTDQTIVCWGNSENGQTDAPEGQFTAIAASWEHGCGLRTDQTAVCWGNSENGQTDAPEGQFTAITASQNHGCGVRVDQIIIFWGDRFQGPQHSSWLAFLTVSASPGEGHWCGLLVTHAVFCWEDFGHGQWNFLEGEFTEVTAGWSSSCGLRIDQSIACWGSSEFGQTSAPDGQFIDVSAGWDYSCGIRTDQTIECWGSVNWPFDGQADVHVFYCAPQDLGYTDDDLRLELETLNSQIAGFFSEQSSDLVGLNFIAASIISPELDWANQRMGDCGVTQSRATRTPAWSSR